MGDTYNGRFAVLKVLTSGGRTVFVPSYHGGTETQRRVELGPRRKSKKQESSS
jgi:hypothetical protein